MPITTENELKLAAKSFYLDRDDIDDTDVWPYIVPLAEGAIFRGLLPDGSTMQPLRVREIETIETVVMASGVGTLPTNFLQQTRVVELASPRRPLKYISPEQADVDYSSRPSGPGLHYTIVGMSIYGYPAGSTSFEVTQYGMPSTIYGDGDTVDTVLSAYPMIYLSAVLAMAAYNFNDDDKITKHLAMLKGSISAANGVVQTIKLGNSDVRFRRNVR